MLEALCTMPSWHTAHAQLGSIYLTRCCAFWMEKKTLCRYIWMDLRVINCILHTENRCLCDWFCVGLIFFLNGSFSIGSWHFFYLFPKQDRIKSWNLEEVIVHFLQGTCRKPNTNTPFFLLIWFCFQSWNPFFGYIYSH